MTRAIKVISLIMLSLTCGSSVAGDKALTNTWSSPHVSFRCTDINDVHWTTGFWAERFATCKTSMVPGMWDVLSDPQTCPAYDNLLIAAGQKQRRHHGAKWFDGDFYKWLETAAYVYGITRNPALDEHMDEIIAVITQTQRADGYIHSPVVIQERTRGSAAREFQERMDFETYNMGHLMTCACVHYRATGKTSLLDIARKATDYLYKLYKTSPEIVANNAICPSHYMTYRKLYVTGATGALYDGASPDGSKSHSAIQLVHQAYGRPYQLPNVTAYNESCATIGYALWNWRMLTITGQARYADQLEQVLYNGVLSTISLDGTKFFYRNTLRQVAELPFRLRWSNQRVPYISCFCCPPNIIRTVAEVSSYAYSLTDKGVWVNLYGSNALDTKMPDGSALKLTQQTDYPWDGSIRFTISDVPDRELSLFLRIPGWSRGARIRVNGASLDHIPEREEYYEIKRAWSKDDRIELLLPMTAQLIEAHPLVEETRNQVALRRGPLVYCLESTDLLDGADIVEIAISPKAKFNSHFLPDLLGGITALKGQALCLPGGNWDKTLYREISNEAPERIDISLIPYYAWGNRGDSEMTVWMPIR